MTEPFFEEDRSFAALIGELTRETTTLFRQEVELAKAEMSQKVSQASNGLAELVIGGLIIFLAFQALLAAAFIGLAPVIGWWQSALVLGIFVLLIGSFVVIRGLSNLKAESLAPQQTLNSLRESGEWVREQFR